MKTAKTPEKPKYAAPECDRCNNTNNGNCWRTKAATLVFQRAYRAVPRLCYEHEDCTASEELSRECLRKRED